MADETGQAYAKRTGPWLHVRGVPGVDGVHLECEIREGRVVVKGMYVHGPEITPSLVHQLPLARIAATWLHPEEFLPEPGTSMQWTFGMPEDPTVGELRTAAKHLGKLQPSQRRRAKRRTAERLNELRDGGLSDEFFTELAKIYREAAAETRAPAKRIADELDVPVKTVHRWVREARLAGALPRARKGAAG
jgi:hypothetical protein